MSKPPSHKLLVANNHTKPVQPLIQLTRERLFYTSMPIALLTRSSRLITAISIIRHRNLKLTWNWTDGLWTKSHEPQNTSSLNSICHFSQLRVMSLAKGLLLADVFHWSRLTSYANLWDFSRDVQIHELFNYYGYRLFNKLKSYVVSPTRFQSAFFTIFTSYCDQTERAAKELLQVLLVQCVQP